MNHTFYVISPHHDREIFYRLTMHGPFGGEWTTFGLGPTFYATEDVAEREAASLRDRGSCELVVRALHVAEVPTACEVEAYADGVQAGRATMARDAAEAASAEAERIRRTGRNHAARLACLRVADAIRALVGKARP